MPGACYPASLAILMSSRFRERSLLKNNKVESDMQSYLHCPLFSIHGEGRGEAAKSFLAKNTMMS